MDLLQGLYQDVDTVLRTYGAAAVFVAIFLESFGLPAPGETILIAAVLAAAQGHTSLVPVALAGWGAAVAGDNVGYAIGRYGGRRLVLRAGHRIGLTEPRLASVEAFFDRYGGWMVIVARFVVPARQLNGIVAGTAGMAWPTFLAFNAMGAALWVGAWTLAGALLGARLHQILAWAHAHGAMAIGGAVLIVALAAGLFAAHRWRRRHSGTED